MKTISQSKYPKAIYVELTDNCNLSCPMCRNRNHNGKNMPIDIFKDIASNLFPHATFIDLRGWGESTVLPNFSDFLQITKQYNDNIKIITNASTNFERLKPLAEHGVLTGISFDACDEITFKKLRGGADINKVISNIKLLSKTYNENGFDPSKLLYFCITVSGDNINQLPEIIKIGITLGIKYYKLEPIKTYSQNSSDLHFHKDKVDYSIMKLKEIIHKNEHVKIELSASLTDETLDQNLTNKICIHPFNYLYINSEGGLGFCDHLNGVKEFVWGKWTNMDEFLLYWNGELLNKFRAEHLNAMNGIPVKMCEDCNWCYSRRYIDLEHLVEPKLTNFIATIT